jgi:DNA-binding response OmpR family regulator
MNKQLLLVIEDDADIRGLVRFIAEAAGFETIEAPDGEAGLRGFFERRPDIVVLDVNMPGLDGWEVLERIRELADTPVLMLTASAGELEKVRGLRGGADDYVTKPFSRLELAARLEALARRPRQGAAEPEIRSDALLEVDFTQRLVRVKGAEVALTPTEFKLAATFARHPNQVLSHDQLLDEVWGSGAEGSRPQVKLYVGYLRRKLRDAGAGDPVETVRGFGYRYRPEPDPG